jgi:hypothetical protein
MRVVVSYVFPHTLSILGPLRTKHTLKWSTILPMQITCMHLHIMISCECLVTHRAWKWPNLSLQCSTAPCNNTSIIRVSPYANSQKPLKLDTLCEKKQLHLKPYPIYANKNYHHTALLSNLQTLDHCWSTNNRFFSSNLFMTETKCDIQNEETMT